MPRSPLPFIRRSSLALLVDDNLVVHAEFALWHSTKVALHHDPARHVGAQDLACGWKSGNLSLENPAGRAGSHGPSRLALHDSIIHVRTPPSPVTSGLLNGP